MNIICIGYYDKFSRFFLDINQHLKDNHNSKVRLKIYSIFLSGFLYTLFRVKFSSWLPAKAWFLVLKTKRVYNNIINESTEYKGVSFNDFIKFHQSLNHKTSTKSLQLQALAYIDIFDALFKKEKPNYLITIGDSRLSIEIAVAIAKQKNIKIYYIEQGPFNKTFFDSSGANANLSIRRNFKSLINSDDLLYFSEVDLKSNSEKYKRLPFYRGLDILLMTLFENTKIYPPDIKYTDINSYKSKNHRIKIEHFSSDTKLKNILLILQVPSDINMIYHSPMFKSHSEIVERVYSNLPKDTKLIIREHPLYINKYEKTLYKFIAQHHITIDCTTNIDTAIHNADVVIVNNSTVGIEAIFKYKPVVVLGNAFYDHKEICLKLKNRDDLGTLIEKALTFIPNIEAINNFNRLLFTSVLLEGSITDKDLKSSKHIANHLLANH